MSHRNAVTAQEAGNVAIKCMRIVLFLFTAAALFAGNVVQTDQEEKHQLDLEIPETVVRGEPFETRLQGLDSHVEEVTFALVDPDGRERAVVDAFRLYSASTDDGYGEISWIHLVGVPSTAEPGKWEVRARAHYEHYSREIAESIRVLEGDYRTMQIALDERLTSLMTEPDPRREEEREELWEILLSSDPQAVYDYGPFEKPVEARRVTAGFGDRREYVYADGSTSRSVHNGIDYAAASGTPVHAGGHGRVRFADERLMTGNTVILEHLPGLFSLYYHMDTIEVDHGDYVLKGSSIGSVGMTGLATGPHLHWEVRLAGVALSPEWFLERRAVDTQ